MTRILLLIALFWICYVAMKRFISSQTPDTKEVRQTEKMVRCSQCGLHVPESESHINVTLVVCNSPKCSNVET